MVLHALVIWVSISAVLQLVSLCCAKLNSGQAVISKAQVSLHCSVFIQELKGLPWHKHKTQVQRRSLG